MKVPLLFPMVMEGRIDECVLLSYRTPAESVRGLVPAGLELVTREANGRAWAFWNIVVCHIEAMRPRGLPRFAGVGYHHVAYRLNVVARTARGERRGLFFVRSDADRRILNMAGNALSDFKFHTAKIELRGLEPGGDGTKLTAKVRARDGRADADLEVDLKGEPALVPGSIFGSVDEARAFLKYAPMGLAPDAQGKRVRLAEVFRNEAAWAERVVRVESARWEFLDRLGQHHIVLELATRVGVIEYRWRLGRKERLERSDAASPA